MLISTATSVIPDHISVQPCQKIGNFGSSWTTVWPFTPFGLLCDWEFRMLNTCIVSSSQIFWEDGHGMRSAWSISPNIIMRIELNIITHWQNIASSVTRQQKADIDFRLQDEQIKARPSKTNECQILIASCLHSKDLMDVSKGHKIKRSRR